MESDYRLVIKDAEEHLVLGAVYVPLSVDSDGETMTAEHIRKMAHKFLASGKVNKVDQSHNFEESGCIIVESYLARKGDPDFTEGTWVAATRITDAGIWEKIQKGEINGYSFAGIVKKDVATVLVESIDSVTGNTEDSTIDILPIHKHQYFLKFADDGKVSTGKTMEVLGHSHSIYAPDATEMIVGHGHRIIM